MQRLGGMDAAFVYGETPTMHMHVCGLIVLDGSSMRGDPYDQIYALLAERVSGIDAMRHKLKTVPLNLGRPVWVDDRNLSIDRHLGHRRLHPPADDRALAALAGEFASRPLSRDRPLWEMLVVEGLTDDRVALLVKMHHSTVDGVTGANLLGDLFDLEPASAERPAVAHLPAPAPSSLQLLEEAVRARLMEPAQIAMLVPATIGRIGGAAWRLLVRHEAGPSATLPFTAPRTSFNSAVSDQRAVSFVDVPLPLVKAVKDALGVTVNDVITAVVGGALRQYLAERDELPAHTLIAAEPVSVHGKSSAADGTTQVSVMFTSLGTDIEDPVEQLRKVAEANRTAKDVHALVGADTLLEWAQHFWFNAFGLGARLYSRLHAADHHPVIHNLILSNVPGPPVPLYLAGARLIGIYPLGPVMDGAGLNVTALSQEDRVGFGMMACAQLVPDVWRLADAIPAVLRALVEATA